MSEMGTSTAGTSTVEGYDAEGFVEFQLSVGAVETRAGTRVLVLPEAILTRLFEAESTRDDLASELAAAVRRTLAEPGGASPEQMATELRGLFAVHGLGVPSLERWGSALVLRWEARPSCIPEAAAVGLLRTLVRELSGAAELGCAAVGDDRFLFVAARHVAAVEKLRGEGLGLGAILDRFVGGAQ